MQALVTNIEWETDGDQEAFAELPQSVLFTHIPNNDTDDDIQDSINDNLSDEFGWLHNGYQTQYFKDDETILQNVEFVLLFTV